MSTADTLKILDALNQAIIDITRSMDPQQLDEFRLQEEDTRRQWEDQDDD